MLFRSKELHDKYTTKINGKTVSKFFLVVGQRNKNVGDLKRQAEDGIRDHFE